MAIDFEANFFTLLELLDSGSRLEVEQACTKVTLQPGQIVYAQGDPANAAFIVVSGRVEAITHSPDGQQSRTVGVMGKGDFFGDLAVLTGQPRLAEVRTCEPTKLMQFEKLAFIRMLDKVPKVGAFFARNLAKRLHRTSTEAHVNVYSMDLAGNLAHFDLLVIFYAIISTGRSGELELHSAENEVIGGFFFREGKLEHARLLHLAGLEATWQGIVQPTSGTFSFHFKDAPASPYPEDQKIELESNDLFSQGAAKRATYQAFPEGMRLMQGRLNRLGDALVWAYGPTQPLAERIWELIAKRPQPLESMWRRLTCSSLTFLETVNILLETKQAEYLPDEPVEARAEGEPGAFPTATPPQT